MPQAAWGTQRKKPLAIDFLAIGHITHDRTPDGFRLGGTVSFAAVTARRLGRQPGIISRGTPEGLSNGAEPSAAPAKLLTGAPGSALAGIPIYLQPSEVSTRFVNIYRGGQRTQMIEAWAEPVAPELPLACVAAPVVLLGPVAREVPAAWLTLFPNALIGVTPQGWLRQWDAAGHVSPTHWADAAVFLQRADTVILSREDVGGDGAYIANLASQTRLLVVTDGWHGATVYHAGASQQIPPRAAAEVDPTGAGDVFTTAFLIRFAETGDPLVAARFANVVASMSVEAPGMEAIPYRAQVDAWLAHHG